VLFLLGWENDPFSYCALVFALPWNLQFFFTIGVPHHSSFPYCHQAPGRAVATGREEWVSAGENARLHRLSSAICQFIQHVQHAFRHDTISSVFAHTFHYNVTGTPNLSLTRRPPTLSSRDVRHENSTRLREREAGSNWECHTLQSPS